MPAITCETTLYTIGTWTILRLPPEASRQLPSRSQVVVTGTLNGLPFQSPLEPDGKGSHWCRIDDTLQRSAGIAAGDTVQLVIEATKDWPEPELPADWRAALEAHPDEYALWKRITPMARWEWLRWIGSTKEPATRERRIAVSLSKMQAGERRPCCFNRNLCSEPYVSHNWHLLEPTK